MQLIVDRYNRKMMVNNQLFTDISQYAIDVILLFQLNKHRIPVNHFYEMYLKLKKETCVSKAVLYTRYKEEKKNTVNALIKKVNVELVDYGLIIVRKVRGVLDLVSFTKDLLYKPVVIYQSQWITILLNKHGIRFRWSQSNYKYRFILGIVLGLRAWRIYIDSDNGTIHKLYDIEEVKEKAEKIKICKKNHVADSEFQRFRKVIKYLVEHGKI